jgi:methyltransferase (TIGR00027 family)
MARTDDDSWDITESVGATALGVAAARAAESDSENPLVVDPYAKVFIDAAGDGMWNMFSTGALPDELADIDSELPARMRAMVDYMASRTVFFDDFFLAAADAGVRQAVILAAGLDARAWRLPWPDGTTVYELDQPKVLEFKSSTLEATGARPTVTLVNVPIDLRQDWPKALQEAGFDATAPSVWSAEGLLPFLPAQAQDVLFDRIQVLSAPGSRIAVEAIRSDFLNPETIGRQRELMQRYRAAAAKMGRTDIASVDDLWFLEERAEVADWLRGHGWDVSVATAEELMDRHHRGAPQGIEDAVPRSLFVSAQLT